MSYFSQMVALTIHNFTSAAVGIGIAAALYLGLHFLAYVVDKGFDPVTVLTEIVQRIYLMIGFGGLMIMTALAVTSSDGIAWTNNATTPANILFWISIRGILWTGTQYVAAGGPAAPQPATAHPEAPQPAASKETVTARSGAAR